MNDAFYNMLGMCMKAGSLSLGEDTCIKVIREDKAFLALVDGAASVNTRKKLSDACAYRNVDLIETDPGEIGRATGRSGRMTCVVTDKGFAEALKKKTGK